ncbi:hypothetical protein M9H77_35681 [Catharanthus roseus]|uniref:Uncharacterized protein n=1 Tax=Catharanthus roseus TaxID=4058 RepID=A0ACB9ZS98_CATRO|nr:hypothetical protein M9H77_35681 [Catharanthus roseus]
MMTSMLQEVNDMASVVIQEPPSSLLQMALSAKKVQTIIWRCMVSIGGTLGCTLSQHDVQQTFHTYRTGVLVELEGAIVDSLVVEQEVDALLSLLFPTNPDRWTPYTSRWREVRDLDRWRESPAGTSLGFSSFCAPPPPGTVGSSTPHQLVSQASSSDDKERADDTDDVQHH